MAIRGAPAIAIAAALALAAELLNSGRGMQFSSPSEAQQRVRKQLAYLVTRYSLGKPCKAPGMLSGNSVALLASAARPLSRASLVTWC